jgi:hypothetical protein
MHSCSLYSTVRVCSLTQKSDAYDPWHLNKRPPAIGDVGTIVEIVSGINGEARYIVEAVHPDGGTLWLSGFLKEEIG